MSRSVVRCLFALLAVISVACDPLVVSPTSSGVGPSTSPTGPEPSVTSSPTVAPTDPPDPTVTWSPVTAASDGPPARFGHTWNADPATAQAYLFGGDDGTAVLADLWAYDLSSDSWDRIDTGDTAPQARSHHAAVWVDDVGVIVVGGQGADEVPLADAWRFDPAAGTWAALPAKAATLPGRSGACVAGAPDGRLWVTHGRAAEGVLLADTWVYDPAGETWTDASPAGEPAPARAGHACWWTDDGRLAIHGGTTGAGTVGDVWTLTAPGTTDAAWTAEPDQEAPARSDAAAVRSGDRFIVSGGLSGDGTPIDVVVAFDASTLAGETFGAPSGGPTPRSGAALVDDPASERMVLFGGLAGAAPTAELWQLAVP